MGRIISNKQYSIRITHPEFGDYYYSHHNLDKRQYVFTQKLSSVSKWKTKKIAEQNLEQMSNISRDCSIIFQVGIVKDDEIVTLGNNMYIFRKRIH